MGGLLSLSLSSKFPHDALSSLGAAKAFVEVHLYFKIKGLLPSWLFPEAYSLYTLSRV